MSYRIGDTLFTAAGRPAVIVGRTEDGTSLKLQVEGEAINAAKQRGYINGLSVDEREQYNEIIDEVRSQSDVKTRVEMLQQKIDTLRRDRQQMNLTRYIEAELAHTMNATGFQPREYTVPETTVL